MVLNALFLEGLVPGDCNKLLHLLNWLRRLFRVKQGFMWRGIRSCNFGVRIQDFLNVNGFDRLFRSGVTKTPTWFFDLITSVCRE